MTNNPTIDGVLRELLERISALWPDGAENDGSGRIGWAPHVTQVVKELRALLDAPSVDQESTSAPFYISAEDWNLLVRGDIDVLAARVSRTRRGKFTEPLFAQPSALQSTIAQLQVRIAELEGGRGEQFQSRVRPWMIDCFGPAIAGDREERNHRFLEEALELVQACGASANEAHQLVEYVYGRPVGEPAQEVGGVMVTLAALCLANGLDMHASGETELARIWTKVEQIRAKQAAKPAMSPLPGVYPDRAPPAPVAVVLPDFDTWYAKNVGVIGTEAYKRDREVWRACLDATAALNGPAK